MNFHGGVGVPPAVSVPSLPMSGTPDRVLGDELGTVYSNKELSKLVEIHAEIEGIYIYIYSILAP